MDIHSHKHLKVIKSHFAPSFYFNMKFVWFGCSRRPEEESSARTAVRKHSRIHRLTHRRDPAGRNRVGGDESDRSAHRRAKMEITATRRLAEQANCGRVDLTGSYCVKRSNIREGRAKRSFIELRIIVWVHQKTQTNRHTHFLSVRR